MPVKVVKINENMLTRIIKHNKICGICREPLNTMKIGDLILRKTAGKSKIAHVDCGIQKNWITKEDVDKVYLPLVTSNM